jgi:DNA-binding MarR family transcriptional regulator/L-amino acid N-acyltransferase YncA
MENLSCHAINQLRHNARSVVRELGLLNDAYFDIGVTLAERHLLIELAGWESPTMGEIAERLLLDKSTVSRLISKAVKKGYVKCIADRKDKRKRFLHLTEKGKETLHAFEPIAYHQTREALLTLTHEEVEAVHQGLALYAKGLRNSRLLGKMTQQTAICQKEENDKTIESLPEIFSLLNQKGYVLKLFEAKDKEGLYAIFQEVVKSGSQFPYECSSIEEFQRQFFHPQGKVYVCRSLAGEVIGGFYIRANYSGRSSHIANAAYMIRDIYRGQGIGSLIIKASLHLAKELGFQAMQFNMVLSKNAGAVKLYKKLGFSIVGTLPHAIRNPDGSYQDGYVMTRKLDHLSLNSDKEEHIGHA